MMSKKTNERQLLRDPDIQPTSETIAEGLGSANDAYVKFISELVNHDSDRTQQYHSAALKLYSGLMIVTISAVSPMLAMISSIGL